MLGCLEKSLFTFCLRKEGELISREFVLKADGHNLTLNLTHPLEGPVLSGNAVHLLTEPAGTPFPGREARNHPLQTTDL